VPVLSIAQTSAPKFKIIDRTQRLFADPRFELLAVVALITIYFGWFAWSVVWSASDNARLVSVFNVDEYAHVLLTKNALAAHSMRIDWIYYGHLYYNILLLPMLLMQSFVAISDQAIIVSQRLLSTLSSIMTIVVAFVTLQAGARLWPSSGI
jgi:hypothetical protein